MKLTVLGLAPRRAEVIVSVARAILAGQLSLEAGAPVEATTEVLASLDVPPRLATILVMRALRWPDAFSRPEALLEQAAAWRLWRAYAALHLACAAVPWLGEIRFAFRKRSVELYQMAVVTLAVRVRVGRGGHEYSRLLVDLLDLRAGETERVGMKGVTLDIQDNRITGNQLLLGNDGTMRCRMIVRYHTAYRPWRDRRRGRLCRTSVA